MFVLDTIAHRLKRGCETMAYPNGPAPALPDRHGGALRVDAAKCADGCESCVPVCPTQAIARPSFAKASAVAEAMADKSEGAARGAVALDLGRCIFCAACVEVCPTKAITQTGDYRMAVRKREDLLLGKTGGEELRPGAALDEKLRRLFGR